MEKNKVRVVYDRRKKSPVKGVGDVELCIYFGPRERKYIKIASVKPEDLYAFQTSDEVKKKIEQCNNVINEMEERNEPMTAEIFSSKFQLLDSAGFIPKTFADFVADMVDSEVMKAGTKKHKKVTLDAIIRFGRFRTFDDITVDNIRLFNDWLHKEGGRTDATVHNYHKHLMKWTRIAFERHYITDDPYKRLHFSRGRSKERNPLTEEELLKLRELPLNGHIERARDLFIFSAYTGLAYADVCAFDFDTMTEKLGDTYYIDGSRLKTGNKFFTPILAPAMEILKKYNYKLHIMSNQKVNDYLHILQDRIETNKSMTFHVARHTFATLCLSHEIPIENVARMLGHTDIKTTQIYAKVLKSTIAKQSARLAASIL